MQMPPNRSAKLEALRAEVDRELRQLRARSDSDRPGPVQRSPSRRVRPVRASLRIGLLVVLPFLLLVRGGTVLYHWVGLPTWLSLTTAAMVTVALLTVYGARVSKSLTGKHRLRFVATKVAVPIIVVYCGYALFYLSRTHAKTEEVRSYYTSIHPLLRIALSTATLMDRELVVTDARRVPEDYGRMGLPVYENSLHFRQPDGYVHAIDLRTLRRARWRNLVLHAYFRFMGFRTLRHVGTADHLHVSLPPE